MWAKERMMEECRRHGLRVTRQRQIIFDALLGHEWISCKEIYYEASSVDPTIGLSTVYRTIRALEEIGILKHGYRYTLPEEFNDKISR